MRVLACIATLLVVGGCAPTTPRPPSSGTRYWLLPSTGASSPLQADMRVTRSDGSVAVVPGAVVLNLAVAHKSIEVTTGMSAQLAVVDLPDPIAFATAGGGSRIIAFSLPWLAALGADGDAIGTTVAHEYAHLKLAHAGPQRNEGDHGAGKNSQVIDRTLTAVVRSSDAASIFTIGTMRGFTSDEERAADELGMAWAMDAGYSPCGRIRAMQVYLRAASSGAAFSFLSVHPRADERIDYARAIVRRRGVSCSEGMS